MTEINQKWEIGDCRDLMQELDPDSIDLIVTDPPYGYSFMGKDWDKAVPSTKIWKECLRILKPGAFAFIMSAPRQDVLAHNLVNLSDAGFETGFTSIYWTFASGFPKAGNVGKLVDKRLGIKRDVIGKRMTGRGLTRADKRNADLGFEGGWAEIDITTPATPQAKALDGSYAGFQPKPAVEIIMVVMKPLTESTYVDQALANGKGITWLDDGRIPYQSDSDKGDINRFKGVPMLPPEKGFNQNKVIIDVEVGQNGGRFPANLLVSNDVLNDGNVTKSPDDYVRGSDSENKNSYSEGIGQKKGDISRNFGDSGSFSRYFDLDAWMNEQIKQLPKEAQKTFPFLITPKASKSEKGVDCTHPTVKPVKLISWLITIGSRKNDLVLDPFLGSGTTLEAGRFTGRRVLGFEISDEWEHLYPARSMSHQPPLSNYV